MIVDEINFDICKTSVFYLPKHNNYIAESINYVYKIRTNMYFFFLSYLLNNNNYIVHSFNDIHKLQMKIFFFLGSIIMP